MDISEAKIARIEAENQIVDILNELEKKTKCTVAAIYLEEERTDDQICEPILIRRKVNISLEV